MQIVDLQRRSLFKSCYKALLCNKKNLVFLTSTNLLEKICTCSSENNCKKICKKVIRAKGRFFYLSLLTNLRFVRKQEKLRTPYNCFRYLQIFSRVQILQISYKSRTNRRFVRFVRFVL